MKTLLISLLCCVLSITSMFSQETPVCAAPAKKYINELALITPTKTNNIKDYINANNIVVNPLTSGFSSGFQVGKHRIVNDQSTLGVILGANAFFSSGATHNQIYQFGAYLTGRLYFGDTWRNGVFAEIGAGPEVAASSIQDGDFQFQANFGSRLGVGYNYQFSKDVTLGLSFITAPSILSDNYFDGSKVIINMLW